MAYRQDGPVPKTLSFTLRIDSAANPDLAEYLWGLPWGARNAEVINLLRLGVQGQQVGLALPPAAEQAPRATPAHARVPPARAAAPVPAPLPAASAEADRAPAIAVSAAAAATNPPPPPAPPAAAVDPTATTATPDPNDQSSAVDLLLDQFKLE